MLADIFAPLARVVPVQIEDDIAVLRGAHLHDLLHKGAVRRAVIGLLRRFAEPAILRERQTDDVGMPIFDRSADGIENMTFSVARPLHAGRIDAAQENRLILRVHELRTGDVENGGLRGSFPCPQAWILRK